MGKKRGRKSAETSKEVRGFFSLKSQTNIKTGKKISAVNCIWIVCHRDDFVAFFFLHSCRLFGFTFGVTIGNSIMERIPSGLKCH